MEKIKTLKINAITLTGSRSYKDETIIEAGDITRISGGNCKGKSSIVNAVAYAFYGVDAFGTQDIEIIRNDHSKTVSVGIDFTDENGVFRRFSRKRTADKTELSLDGRQIRQTDIDAMLGDKDAFLSLFNPSYFVEVMGNKAKQFLEIRLPSVKPEQVLGLLTENERILLKDADLNVPELSLQNNRAEITCADGEYTRISGQITELRKNEGEKAQKIAGLETDTDKLKKRIKELEQKQFSGINTDDLNMEKCVLDDRLKSSGNDETRKQLEAALFEAESREYKSAYAEHIREKESLLKAMSIKYNELKQRLENTVVGSQCPTCFTMITPENIEGIKNGLEMQIKEVFVSGKDERAKFNELQELDRQAKEKFDEFVKSDIAKIKRQIAECTPNNHSEVYGRLKEINRILKYGNLSEAEHTELTQAGTELNRLTYNYNELKNTDYAGRIEELKSRQSELAFVSEKARNEITALQEYIAKRSEIALSGFKTPNVTIRFYEIIRSTGELKPCFKFLYRGRKYPALSLSEKVRAGLEITALLRSLLQLDYPVFIDNSESIEHYNGVTFPSQTFILKFVKGAELNVEIKNIQTAKVPAAA